MPDNGDPAFPVPNDANVNGPSGMSLLDWFAGQALASYDWMSSDEKYEVDAGRCYQIAKAMLERKRIIESTPE